MVRETMDISGIWRFQPDPMNDGERLEYGSPVADDSLWSQARVPGSYDSQNENLAFYEGKVWYRTSFLVPGSWQRRRVVLTFHGVNYRARVWLNGTLLGENRDPFLPFSFPVDSNLVADGQNVLAVCVDNRSYPEDIPGRYIGWRNFGGILREVTLTATGPTYLASTRVTAEPDGRFQLAYSLHNETHDPVDSSLVVIIADAGQPQDGHEIVSRDVTVAAGTQAEGTLNAAVPGVAAWTPDKPQLYVARVELRRGGEVLDRVDAKFGFRRIEARGTDLLLNGTKIFLMGFNRHEDSPRTDMAFDADTMRHDLEMMKDAGCNFIRLCHYPHHPAELDLCDELGLLVMEEIPFWGDAVFHEHHSLRAEAAERQLRKMIARDCNHPSVIFWSVSNETREEAPEIRETNRHLVRLAKALDPSRLVTHVSNRFQGPNADWQEDDVICGNAYPAVWGPARARKALEDQLPIAARTWGEGWLPWVHSAHPDRPILITEFGYASIAGTRGGPFSETWHAELMTAEFRAIAEKDYVCGAVIWCWADHPWPPAQYRWAFGGVTISPFGVVTRSRWPKLSFAAARDMFRAQRGAGGGCASEGPTERSTPELRQSGTDACSD